ncbi:MAG: IS66 family insertion sequence element accessory protein TnpB [Candidatus Thorarchaeota archaeon]
MLMISGNSRVFLFRDSVHMGTSFDGLIALAEKHFPGNLKNNSFFVFMNTTMDRIKVLYWDENGFVVWYKKLSKGKFLNKIRSNNMASRRELLELLEDTSATKTRYLK